MFASFFLILLFLSNSNLVVDLAFVSGESDKDLLLEFRQNLVYDSSVSTKLSQWDESTDFCRWVGVECNGARRVSGLDLSEEPISDYIKINTSLLRLTHLQSLSLAQTSFHFKQFPSGFGQLTELRHLNLSYSGFSGQIPSDLSNLTRLVCLDLSTAPYLRLSLPNLRGLIHNYTRLKQLYLDGVNISANGSEWGSAISSSLPNLRVLGMSNSFLTGPFHPSLLNLRSLSEIHLDFNNFSSPFPDFFSDFPDLKVLSMSYCELSGVVPPKLFQIRSLQSVYLRGNEHLGGSFPEFPVDGSLQELVLSWPRFSGTLPESIGNLRMLSELSVSGSNISGSIPSTIQNLRRLVVLDLSGNQFSGQIPSLALFKNLTAVYLSGNRFTGQIPDSLFEGLEYLVSLDLSGNSLEGEIPASLFLLPSLQVLYLSDNSFSGVARVSTDGSLSPIRILSLLHNKFEGSIPRILFELSSLEVLSLSGNKFSGALELTDFHKLANLSTLRLSYNDLSLHVNEEASMSALFPRLVELELVSCKLQKLPDFRNHSSLFMLDLSNNELYGPIPNWMWEINNGNLGFLNLSHNQLTHLQEPYNLSGLIYLDVHDNMLVGQIPMLLSSSANVLDFSSNRFSSLPPSGHLDSLSPAAFFSAADNEITGEIPLSFCNASILRVLDLSNNRFSGRIPSCLVNDALRVLNLKGNRLDGYIPDAFFPVGCSLATLDLSRNSLRGKLPESLTRCSQLEVLDLSNNALHDALPCWLEALSRLRVLVLRSNMFHGNIGSLGETGSWRNLHILDLASNNIGGVMTAELFRNLQGFMIDATQLQRDDILQLSVDGVSGVYYRDSVKVTMKGSEHELKKILGNFSLIDLSCNHIQGVIPEEIGELKLLYVVNFSHNALSGNIPPSMGNLEQLGSLDLSFNALMGEIPRQLEGFTTSFVGNEGLCGFPVNKTCIGDGESSLLDADSLSEHFCFVRDGEVIADDCKMRTAGDRILEA
ncbi:receptor-like protein 7 [Salvia miltiorrhiza]|uniref:receptor-like protein 7 n=1 Tax=Salvia miltiorrhiza TaxID=226208 RepID=UPI0025AB7C3E|nr:receptor-like protein 7 [Salvia miltiorrhiza]